MVDEATDAAAPKKLEELPPYVRRFLAGLKEDDVDSFANAMEFFKWFRTTGKVTKVVIVTGLSVFGAMVAAAQGWDYIVGKFFSK